MTLMKRVREYLAERTGEKWTQARFAETIGWSQAAVAQWEHAGRQIKSHALCDIHEKLGIDWRTIGEWLMEERGEVVRSLPSLTYPKRSS
jgi:transcriptional regulator with XRE-family HTH domain